MTTTTALQALIAECERANSRALSQIGMGLIDLNAIERARAALAAPAPALDAPADLFQLFREALAWGLVYGPHIASDRWDDMRDDMAKSFAARAALSAAQDAPADSYESIWNALQRIDTAAAFLPGFEVRHEGGIEAFTQNIIDAIARASQPTPARDAAATNSVGVPLSCGKPLCSPSEHHPLGHLAHSSEVRAQDAAATVPAGWKLVPEKITEDMHVAAVKTIQRCTGNDDFPRRVYAAMLAATPPAPQVAPTAAQATALVPLTDEQIVKAVGGKHLFTVFDAFRLCERAHGIGTTPKEQQ